MSANQVNPHTARGRHIKPRGEPTLLTGKQSARRTSQRRRTNSRNNQHSTTINIDDFDELLIQKYPARLIKAIGTVNLTVEEAIEWQKNMPPIVIRVAKDGGIDIAIKHHLSRKQLLAIAGGFVTVTWALIQLTLQYWPAVQHLLLKA